MDNHSGENSSQKLPEFIKNYHYAAEKLNEMSVLIDELKNPQNTKRVFQLLPRHMRRRTQTHQPKRLPRKHRRAHIAQMTRSGLPQKTKRPSRKFRRKPNNLMMEYIRRQRDKVWLETHIWHAKRFHMTERFGYKLPLAPCDKNFRACYRATTKHCLVQDISYHGCVELSGPIDEIKLKFSYITSSKVGFGVTAKIYIDGLREGCIDIFQRDKYPFHAIGRVSFVWHPAITGQESSSNRRVWFFAHPGFYSEFLAELTELFEVKRVVPIESEPKKKIVKGIAKVYAFDRTPRYENQKSSVTIVELKDTLNRFRLTGPLAQAVLTKAFKCKNLEQSDLAESHQHQSEYWSSLKDVHSPAELPPNMVLALNIEDPRLNRPKKRTKAVNESDSPFGIPLIENSFAFIPKQSNLSRIWSSDVRNRLMDSMMSTYQLCLQRNEQVLVPGERAPFEDDLQSVPVLLIQQPGSQNSDYKRVGYGSGWDVIIPAGYGISTWICLIMWGARAGGLREARSIRREAGIDEFLPDTIVGVKDDERRHALARTSYFRRPQNKRINYNKFAISSPFKCPWSRLVNEWQINQSNNDQFFVLREPECLKGIDQTLRGKSDIKSLSLPPNCLIPVYLSIINRGSAKDNSIICLPRSHDFKMIKRNRQRHERSAIHTEPLRLDGNERERKKLRKDHKVLLKRLRNRRVRAKRKLQETSERRVKISAPLTKKLITEQLQKMSNLWLKENPDSVRHQCSREVFGYLSQGEFSFTEAKGCGIGYVTGEGLKILIRLCAQKNSRKVVVLVRNPGSRNYRIADIKIRFV